MICHQHIPTFADNSMCGSCKPGQESRQSSHTPPSQAFPLTVQYARCLPRNPSLIGDRDIVARGGVRRLLLHLFGIAGGKSTHVITCQEGDIRPRRRSNWCLWEKKVKRAFRYFSRVKKLLAARLIAAQAQSDEQHEGD
jgi:hypothetical protein